MCVLVALPPSSPVLPPQVDSYRTKNGKQIKMHVKRAISLADDDQVKSELTAALDLYKTGAAGPCKQNAVQVLKPARPFHGLA